MAKKKEEDKLTPFQTQFVDVWFNMNFNGKLSYKQLKPNVTNETAQVEASKLLSLPIVQDYIELKREQIRLKEEISLEFIISELKAIIYDVKSETIERDDNGRITAKPDRRSALEALKLITRIGGYDTKKVDVTTNGESINQIIWKEEKNYDKDTEDEAN